MVTSSARLEPVRRILERLRAAGIEAWVCGGWAEEIYGLTDPCEHGDVDLLYPAPSFAAVDELLRAGTFQSLGRHHWMENLLIDGQKVTLVLYILDPDGGWTDPKEPGGDRFLADTFSTVDGLPVASLAYVQPRQKHRQHDLAFARRILDLLGAQGMDVWVFGEWADRLHGKNSDTRNKRVELLYRAPVFDDLEAFAADQGWREYRKGIHPGLREFIVDGTRVRVFLVEEDRKGLYTQLVWQSRFRWPEGVRGEVDGIPVASVEALDRFYALKKRGRLRRRLRLWATRAERRERTHTRRF